MGERDRAGTIGDDFMNGTSHGFLIGADDFVNPGTGVFKVEGAASLVHDVMIYCSLSKFLQAIRKN